VFSYIMQKVSYEHIVQRLQSVIYICVLEKGRDANDV